MRGVSEEVAQVQRKAIEAATRDLREKHALHVANLQKQAALHAVRAEEKAQVKWAPPASPQPPRLHTKQPKTRGQPTKHPPRSSIPKDPA